MGRFVKGQSGNPNGRPRKRRPHVSAFDIILDKSLTVTENGIEREMTVDEALQLQTYQAALKGSKMAIRHVLKMIEKRERALQAATPQPEKRRVTTSFSYDSDSANEAMLLLDIACRNPDNDADGGPRPLLVQTWAAQAGLSRPGRRPKDEPKRRDLELFVHRFAELRLPRGRV